MAINDILNRLSRKQEIDENNPDTYDTGVTSTEQDVEDQLAMQDQNMENPPFMMQGVPYTERPEREAILDRDAMFKNQAAIDEAINTPGVVESGATSPEELDILRGNTSLDPERSPAAEQAPPKSKEEMLMEQLQKMQQTSDDELKSAKSMDRWMGLANALNRGMSKLDQASVLKATRTPGMKAMDPAVIAGTSSAKEVLAERQAKINELMQQQKLQNMITPKSMSKLDEAKIKESEAKAKLYESKAKQSSLPSTSIFEKKKQEKLATSGAEYITKDRDQYLNNINKINNAIDILDKDDIMTSGRVVGRLPDFMRTESSITARENIQSAIQETLRPTLGAQFTEKEGERIMNLQYNENLDESQNKDRAVALKKFIEKKVKFADDLYSYMDEKGSDKGFPYEKYGMQKAADTVAPQGDPKKKYKQMSDAELREVYNKKIGK